MTITPEIVATGRRDEDIARDINGRLWVKLSEVCLLMNEASAAKMRVEFNLGVDAFGRNVIQRLDIVKSML
jgi:hypothetical protein